MSDENRRLKDEKRIAEYLGFLQSMVRCGSDYLFLLHLQTQRVWMMGGIEETFSVPDKGDRESYCTDDWYSCIFDRDLPFLIADVQKLIDGEKDLHDMDYRVKKRQGGYTWVRSQGTVLKDEDGNPFVMVGRVSEDALRFKTDALTGLFNAEQMTEDMQEAIDQKMSGYCLQIGIDNLKNINTIHGRMIGDKALQKMAEVMREEQSVPKAYRLGGDVFVTLMYEASEGKVWECFKRMQKAVAGHFTISGGAVPLDISGLDVSRLLQYLEFVLMKTKQRGKNNLTIFQMDDYVKEKESISLLGELIKSVNDGCEGFSLVYQPQFKTGTYHLFGAEALLRYESPTRGRVFPDEFIPILERSELMYPVGLWVLENALEQCKKWREKMPDFHISVNISYFQLSKQDITEHVMNALEASGLPGDALTLEVTESMQLQNYQHYNEIFSVWKNAGIEISVDDFGTGYSSLGYLKNLNIDEIKIDKCFVSGIQSSGYNYLLLKNMVELAADSQIRVCCEGVEESEELQVLETLKPELLQGYLFARPCEVDEFEKLIFEQEAPEYHRYLERIGNHRDDRIVSFLQFNHREILQSVGIGLWIARATEQGYEMYMDETMRRKLGMGRNLSPAQAHKFWLDRVAPDSREELIRAFQIDIRPGKVVELTYHWIHPRNGMTTVHCTGVFVESQEGEICMQGYHKVLKNKEK